MDIEALARKAHSVLDFWNFWCEDHGIEVAPGFFNLYNEVTHQSKMVLYHPESGMVFKSCNNDADCPDTNSRRVLGEVVWDGVVMPVRLPYFEIIEVADFKFVEVQEYVLGESCSCEGYRCKHRKDMYETTRYNDAHKGNWKITPDGEVILFDFDGIRL